MKKTNSVVLLIVSLLLIIIGGGIYFAQKSGRLSLFAAFAGWPDVPVTDSAYTELTAIGEKGWVDGYYDGTYRPNIAADRAQVVVSAIKVSGIKVIDASEDGCFAFNGHSYPYPDVPCTHWAIDYIWTAKKNNLITPFSNGTFQPDRAATKAELLALLMDITGTNVPNYTCSGTADYPFPDVSCGYWAYDYIRLAKENNIVFGSSGDHFEPEVSATRRDLGVILYRMFISAASEVTISGQVTDADTSSPIIGASLYIDDVSAQGSKLSTSSDSTGAYSLRFVSAPTAYTVTASATGYQSKTVSISASQNASLDITLSAIAEATEGTISGYVRNSDTRKAIAGASVVVIGYENGSQLSDKTDSNGYYSLKVAPTSGTFSVKASASGYSSRTSSVTLSGGVGSLSFSLLSADQDSSGDNPEVISGTGGSVSAASTGSALSVALVLIGTILALFSLIYLLKTNKKSA